MTEIEIEKTEVATRLPLQARLVAYAWMAVAAPWIIVSFCCYSGRPLEIINLSTCFLFLQVLYYATGLLAGKHAMSKWLMFISGTLAICCVILILIQILLAIDMLYGIPVLNVKEKYNPQSFYVWSACSVGIFSLALCSLFVLKQKQVRDYLLDEQRLSKKPRNQFRLEHLLVATTIACLTAAQLGTDFTPYYDMTMENRLVFNDNTPHRIFLHWICYHEEKKIEQIDMPLSGFMTFDFEKSLSVLTELCGSWNPPLSITELKTVIEHQGSEYRVPIEGNPEVVHQYVLQSSGSNSLEDYYAFAKTIDQNVP